MKTKNKKNIIKELKEWTIYLIIPFAIVTFINSEIFALSEVSGASMENTLIDGERLFIDKISYNFLEPKSEDIIVFLEGEISEGVVDRYINVFEDIEMKIKRKPRRNRFIKRVIGIPGDIVEIKNNEVYINDQLLQESYIKGETTIKDVNYPITVPEGKLFVMGDNRENSHDSRAFGLVDYRSIEGRAVYRISPVNKLGEIK